MKIIRQRPTHKVNRKETLCQGRYGGSLWVVGSTIVLIYRHEACQFGGVKKAYSFQLVAVLDLKDLGSVLQDDLDVCSIQ